MSLLELERQHFNQESQEEWKDLKNSLPSEEKLEMKP